MALSAASAALWSAKCTKADPALPPVALSLTMRTSVTVPSVEKISCRHTYCEHCKAKTRAKVNNFKDSVEADEDH